jgi:hypothetical protein
MRNPLPANLSRRSVVAWVAYTDAARRGENYVKATELRPLFPADDAKDYQSCESNEEKSPSRLPDVSVIPALKDTFLIEQELNDGSMARFCYEINGIFTDYQFDTLMKKMQGSTFGDNVIYDPEHANLYRVNDAGVIVEKV